jgi:hypothetical protein
LRFGEILGRVEVVDRLVSGRSRVEVEVEIDLERIGSVITVTVGAGHRLFVDLEVVIVFRRDLVAVPASAHLAAAGLLLDVLQKGATAGIQSEHARQIARFDQGIIGGGIGPSTGQRERALEKSLQTRRELMGAADLRDVDHFDEKRRDLIGILVIADRSSQHQHHSGEYCLRDV